MKGLELVGHLQITTYTLFLFIYCDLLVVWALEVGSLLPDFLYFQILGLILPLFKVECGVGV